jgi:hypothetical protein
MQQVLALTLLVASLVFFVRNLYAVDEVSELAKRVHRKLYRLAGQLQFVVGLNDDVIGQLKENSEVKIVEAPEKPSLDAHRASSET